MHGGFYKKKHSARTVNTWLLMISMAAINALLLHLSGICWAKNPPKKTNKSTLTTKVAKENSRKLGVQPKGQKSPSRAPANAATKKGTGNGPLSRSIASDSDKALEVRGQSRNLSLMLVLKNNKESLDFVQPRSSFRKEIQNTNY